MNRRGFLKSATQVSLAATVATWPAFLREAFAGSDKAPSDALAGLAVVSEGYRRAQRAGKPLLVFIIPEKPEGKYQRGAAFGAFLNHGSVEQLYPLALCEVVCATLSDVRSLVPSVGSGEPLMVLVETEQVPATVQRLEATLAAKAELGSQHRRTIHDWERMRQAEAALIDTHTMQIADLIRTAVLGKPGLLEQRQRQALSLLPKELVTAVGELVSTQPSALAAADLSMVDRAAVLLVEAAEKKSPGVRHEVQTLLRNAVQQRVVKTRVPGSHWAHSSGCATSIEGVPSTSMIACGMGHVPDKSRRFLYFFTLPKNPFGFDP